MDRLVSLFSHQPSAIWDTRVILQSVIISDSSFTDGPISRKVLPVQPAKLYSQGPYGPARPPSSPRHPSLCSQQVIRHTCGMFGGQGLDWVYVLNTPYAQEFVVLPQADDYFYYFRACRIFKRLVLSVYDRMRQRKSSTSLGLAANVWYLSATIKILVINCVNQQKMLFFFPE